MKKFKIILFCLLFFVASYASAETSDPLESINRPVFWFNDKVDSYVLKPVAQGYKYIAPVQARTGISNFFDNIRYPIYLVSDVVQFKFTQAAEHTGRFLINSTIGIGGFLDVAKGFGLERHREDFGTALGYHGVPDGPYIVLPFLGPSNLRDTIGLVVDRFIHPSAHITRLELGRAEDNLVTYGLLGTEVVSTREQLLGVVDSAKSASLDYYLFVRSAYKQSRDGLISDGAVVDEFEDDFEFEDDE